MESSTSSKPESKDPFLTLPPDIHAKIIGHLPIAQWPSLELVSKNFQSATWIAWRQLRYIDLERELSDYTRGASTVINKAERIESILQKLVERSPFLTRIDIILDDAKLNLDAVLLLAQFEHLQSISMGDAKWFSGGPGGIQLENVVTFLETTRSRTSLKELHLLNVEGRLHLDRFATTFASGREIQFPLKLEKFSYMSSNRSLNIRLDTMDTTRLTDVRVGRAAIEPEQLTNLIERAANLCGIELSFFGCDGELSGSRLQANKKLLVALASHENLTSIKFACCNFSGDDECTNFRPEFMEMLKVIGCRGKLSKLRMEKHFVPQSSLDMNEICTTIRDYIPYLQSIKLHNGYNDGLTEESICNIVSLPELEEIDFVTWDGPLATNAIKIIAHLPHLKRLAFSMAWRGVDAKSLLCLAKVTSLIDLRIGDANFVNAEVFEKWSNGFASNLQILMLRGIIGIGAEVGLVRLLEKAVRLRVLVLHGSITDRSLMAISNSCPELEILELEPYYCSGITIQRLQEIVDRCPKLKRLGGMRGKIRMQLQLSKYRKINDVDTKFWNHWRYNYDNRDYDS